MTHSASWLCSVAHYPNECFSLPLYKAPHTLLCFQALLHAMETAVHEYKRAGACKAMNEKEEELGSASWYIALVALRCRACRVVP